MLAEGAERLGRHVGGPLPEEGGAIVRPDVAEAAGELAGLALPARDVGPVGALADGHDRGEDRSHEEGDDEGGHD